jgi:Flp pilus assembly protein TadG
VEDRKTRGERGANLVEFAVVAPLLVLLLLGIADIGRAFYSYITITNAAREGVRFASRFPDNLTDIQAAAVRETTGTPVALSSADVTVPFGFNGTRGNPITVRVQHRYAMLFLSALGFGDLNMQAQATMVIFGRDPQEP